MLGVTKVVIEADYIVSIVFNDGQSGLINFKDELEKDHRPTNANFYKSDRLLATCWAYFLIKKEV